MSPRQASLQIAALTALAISAVSIPARADQKRTLISKTYFVDRKYSSMKGPQSTQEFTIGDPSKPELVWVTGYEAVMVGKDGESPMPQDFMCHSNLDVDPLKHRTAFESEPGISGRLFTLSQGQLTIAFPDGFGIPMISSEPLSLTTQVLNLNEEGKQFNVRHKVTVKYMRDADAKGVKPLFQKSVYGLKLLEGKDGNYGNPPAKDEEHGAGCLEGSNASNHTYDDQYGRKFTGHWVVQPGREVNKTPVTKLLQLPYDTPAHYIAVHLHPFAESLELVDLTEKKTVFKSNVRGLDGRIGIAQVDYFASKQGLMMYDDHEYELVSVYNNTTKQPQDSMAVMYIYFLDKKFDKPDADEIAKTAHGK
jgi:hypothetical protein